MSRLISFIIICSLILGYSHNPLPENVGAYQQFTCFQCHNTWPENATESGSVQIYGIPEIIEPGARYAVDVVVSNTYNNASWGFEIASFIGYQGPLLQAGSWELTDPTKTIAEIANNVVYVKQTSDGTFQNQSGSASWPMIWTAPDDYYGAVRFYATGVAGDGELGNLGDYSYKISLFATVVPPDSEYPVNVDYYSEVVPIFQAYCMGCHLADYQYNDNGLALDSYPNLMAGGNTGPAIIPFDAENSLLVKAIEGRANESDGIASMPYFQPLINETLRNVIRAWIDEGAEEFPCILGDYNFDNQIDVSDVVQLVDCILNLNCDLNSCADINEDGSLSVADIIIIVNVILEG